MERQESACVFEGSTLHKADSAVESPADSQHFNSKVGTVRFTDGCHLPLEIVEEFESQSESGKFSSPKNKISKYFPRKVELFGPHVPL